MNGGDPNGIDKDHLSLRESDMPVVVLIPGKVKTGVAKGHYCKHIFVVTNTVRIDLQTSSERRSIRAGRGTQKGQTIHVGSRMSK